MALALVGCASTTPGLDAEGLIPKALTTCADAPAVPAHPLDAQGHTLLRTDAQKAGYLAGLHGAYEDCKGTVAAIALRRSLLDKQTGQGGFHFKLPKITF